MERACYVVPNILIIRFRNIHGKVYLSNKEVKYQPSQVSCNNNYQTARRTVRPTLLTAFASTLSIKLKAAAAWAAILYLSLHHCPAGFSNVKNVTAFNIWKENLSSQGISLSTTLICPEAVKPPLCNDVTISHIWNILTSISGDMNALNICAWAMIRRLLVGSFRLQWTRTSERSRDFDFHVDLVDELRWRHFQAQRMRQRPLFVHPQIWERVHPTSLKSS